MKYQQRYNISDIGVETLIKFLRHILSHFKIDGADRLPKSINTIKSSLGILTKYNKYAICPKCHKLYDPLVVKEVNVNDQECKKCTHVEYPKHRVSAQRSACNEPLAELIKTNNGTLIRPLKLYPVGSIKQQLYMIYQRVGFEKMLQYSSKRKVSDNIFFDIYARNI